MMQLRVWSEFLTPEELCQPPVAKLLAAFDCGVLLRVDQSHIDERLAESLRACAAAGVPGVGLWLLLDAEAGYWPSERNAHVVRELVQQALRLKPAVPWLAIDLEPPLRQATALAGLAGPRALLARSRFALENLAPRRFQAAWGIYRDVIGIAHGAGLRVLCAAHDYLAEDAWLGRPVLQDVHEAPVLGLPWDALSVMLYGSMMGVATLDARRWMYDTARLLRTHRVGASIGLTGAGALGDEPHYDSPGDLGGDAAAVKAAGVADFAIYSLEGILQRPCPEDWLRAVIDAEPRVPPPSQWARRERRRRRAAAVLWACCRIVARGRAPSR
jgi:hypothetical protein